jgi:hypothetical protein
MNHGEQVWRLMQGEELLAELIVTGGTSPWLNAQIQAMPRFEAVRPPFEQKSSGRWGTSTTTWAPGKPPTTASARPSAFTIPTVVQYQRFCCTSIARMPGGARATSRSLGPRWKPDPCHTHSHPRWGCFGPRSPSPTGPAAASAAAADPVGLAARAGAGRKTVGRGRRRQKAPATRAPERQRRSVSAMYTLPTAPAPAR